jgi:hypothetical protein
MTDSPNPLAGPDAPPLELQRYSLAFLCQMLRQLPPQIMAIADGAGVAPVAYHDGVPIFDGCGVVRMAEHVAKFRQTVEDQIASN